MKTAEDWIKQIPHFTGNTTATLSRDEMASVIRNVQRDALHHAVILVDGAREQIEYPTRPALHI